MQAFNPKNGRIYTETTTSSAKSMIHSTWKTRATGRVVYPPTARHANGASSLQAMALRMCLFSIDLFVPEALAYPGWELTKRLYRELKSRDALSFEAWKLFQEAFPDQPELSHEFRLDVNDAITSWPFIVKDLGTVDTSVLTHFCANGLTLDLAGLISLTAIPTLTTLMHINPAQRQTYPLTGIAIRDWCRAVAEKNAFPNLKLLYLSAISNYQPTDSSVLGHLSSFPALALVGIERSESQLPINNSDTCGQWQRSTANREHKLNTTMHDAQTTIAQKTKALYRHACRVSTSQKEVADVTSVLEGPIQLTLSCYASQSKRDAGTAMWFVRRHYAPLELLKRDLNVLSHRHDGDRGTKKRKIRQTKQCDVGALLDSFGAPAGSE